MAVKITKKKKKEVTESPAAEVVEESAPKVDPDQVLDNATETTNVSEAVPEAAPEPPPEAAPAAESVPEVSAAPGEDYVRVVMLREIAPPPVMGKTNLAELLGVTALKEGKEYMVPYPVACILKDAKAVMMFGA